MNAEERRVHFPLFVVRAPFYKSRFINLNQATGCIFGPNAFAVQKMTVLEIPDAREFPENPGKDVAWITRGT